MTLRRFLRGNDMLLATSHMELIGEEAKMHGIRTATVFWKKVLLARFLAKEMGYKQSLPVEKISDLETAPEYQDLKKPKLHLGSISETDVIARYADCNNNIKGLPAQVILPGDIEAGELKRKIPAKPDNGQEYRISPDPSETICASFHQKSGRRGLSKYRGSQCTSMALSAVMVSKTLPVSMWRTGNLDAILKFGDRFHGELLSSLDRKSTDPRIALHEIPSGDQSQCQVPVPSDDTKWFAKDYDTTQVITLSKSEEFYGQVRANNGAYAMQNDLGDTPMEVSLSTIFEQKYDGAIITVGNVSGAIIKDSHDRVRYFDSHCNNKIGRLNLDGTAVLLVFNNVQEFVRHIRKREPSAHCRYEMVGININSENNSFSHREN